MLADKVVTPEPISIIGNACGFYVSSCGLIIISISFAEIRRL